MIKQQDEMWVEVLRWWQPQQNWEIFEDIYLNAPQPYEKKIGYRYPAHSGWILAPPLTLDSLHEAEKKLTQGQIDRYTIKLGIVIGDEKLNKYNASWDRIHASAEQRLLALWRTVNVSPSKTP